MKKVLIHNNNKDATIAVRENLEKVILDYGYEVVTESPDLIAVIGGDGTMLSAIREYKDLDVPYVGIDTGSLGFLPSILPEHLEEIINILNGTNHTVKSYPMLKVVSKTVSGKVIEDYAFNEVLIKHLEPKLMEAKIFTNGKPFNYFTGDGFIVSTPVGATGYSIWAGGAATHSELQAFQLTPLNPNDNSINRPLKSSMVVPLDTTLDFEIIKAEKRKVIVACDGSRLSNDYIATVHINASESKKIKIIRSDTFDYFELYRRKIIDKNIRNVIY